MSLWIRVKRIFYHDWSVCDSCGRTISSHDWSWLHKPDEKWYCHPCAIQIYLKQKDLTAFTLLTPQNKDQAAAEDHDYSFWIAISLVSLFLLLIAAIGLHPHQ